MGDHPITGEMAVRIAQQAQMPVPPSALPEEERRALEERELAVAIARADAARAGQQAQWKAEEAVNAVKMIVCNNARFFTNDAEHAAQAVYLAWNTGLCRSAVSSPDGERWFAQATGFPRDVVAQAFAEAKARLRRGGLVRESEVYA